LRIISPVVESGSLTGGVAIRAALSKEKRVTSGREVMKKGYSIKALSAKRNKEGTAKQSGKRRRQNPSGVKHWMEGT